MRSEHCSGIDVSNDSTAPVSKTHNAFVSLIMYFILRFSDTKHIDSIYILCLREAQYVSPVLRLYKKTVNIQEYNSIDIA